MLLGRGINAAMQRTNFSRFRLIGPPVNRVTLSIGPNCKERDPIKENALGYVRLIEPQL